GHGDDSRGRDDPGGGRRSEDRRVSDALLAERRLPRRPGVRRQHRPRPRPRRAPRAGDPRPDAAGGQRPGDLQDVAGRGADAGDHADRALDRGGSDARPRHRGRRLRRQAVQPARVGLARPRGPAPCPPRRRGQYGRHPHLRAAVDRHRAARGDRRRAGDRADPDRVPPAARLRPRAGSRLFPPAVTRPRLRRGVRGLRAQHRRPHHESPAQAGAADRRPDDQDGLRRRLPIRGGGV
ncbi:MAG: Phosphate regulon transcriptional regulatory protein PhoB (SphR), partial [uncultured Thermomicrobiales bacterium]